MKGFVLKLEELNEDFITEIYSKLIRENIEISKINAVSIVAICARQEEGKHRS